MKPRVSAPISVGDDDDDDDGANNAEEQLDGAPLRSMKRTKGAMDLDLDWTRHGGWGWRRYGYKRLHRALHVRHAPAYTQLAVVPVERRVWPVPTQMPQEAE